MEQAELAVWEAPGCAWRVKYAPALLEEIRRQVLEAFFAVPRGGAETGGVLYGARENGCVRVAAFRPLACEHLSGPSFVLSPKDHHVLAALLKAPESDVALRGLAPVGWYHSHTRSEIFLSGQDLEVHGRYFREPWQIALVLRPGALVTRAGFFARDPQGRLNPDASGLEFVVAPLALPESGAAPRAAAGTLPASTGRPERPPQAEGLPHYSAPEPDLPRFLAAVPPAPRRMRRAWLATPLLALALGLTAFFTRDLWLPAPAAPLGLYLRDHDGQLEVRWNAQSAAIRRAEAGKVDIADGAGRRSSPLGPQQLRAGVLSYARQAERVDVRLTVEYPPGRRTEATATFLGPPPGASTSELAELTRQKVALEQELHRARTEMLNQAILINRLQANVAALQARFRKAAPKPPAPAAAPTAPPAVSPAPSPSASPGR